jgi:hypothetical protein
MELGSKEHKQLLWKGILKISLKIASVGLFIGVLLMIPMLVRENTFSSGLFYLGSGIVIFSFVFAAWLSFKKYKMIIKPFSQTYQDLN